MKNIFKQGVIFFLFFCLWYLFFLFLTYLFYPETNEVDNSKVSKVHLEYLLSKNIFLSDAQNVALGFWVSKQGPKRIIILGASNASAGIYPSILRPILPDFTIYNASVGASNITRLRGIVDLVDMLKQGPMKKTIFIIGIYFGSFGSDNAMAGQVLSKNQKLTFLQAEELRYGLYKLKDNKVELAIDPYFMPVAVRSLRPFVLWHRIFYIARLYYDDFCASFKHQDDLKGEAWKQDVLAHLTINLGSIDDFAQDAQIHSFVTLCKEIEQSGASLVVVDLPTPQWLRERSEYYKKYALKRSLYINEIEKMPRVKYFDLGTHLPGLTDLNFRDSAHPTDEEAKVWSKAVAEFVASQRQFLSSR